MSQRQAQSRPAKLAGNASAGLGERLEDFHLGFLGDANAGIAHFNADPTFQGAQAHIDAAKAGELQGVGEQVADDLPHTGRVADHLGGKLRVDQAGQLHARSGILREQVGGIFHQ